VYVCRPVEVDDAADTCPDALGTSAQPNAISAMNTDTLRSLVILILTNDERVRRPAVLCTFHVSFPFAPHGAWARG
jgi:hypothetical protein